MKGTARLPVYREIKIAVVVKLAPRELEFLQMRVGEELSYKEIAERMKITVRGVKDVSARLVAKISRSNPDRGITQIAYTKFAILHKIVTLEGLQ